MYKTAIIAAAKGYDVEDITPWALSLKNSGFDGKVFVILYQPTQEGKKQIVCSNHNR
jgi:hypothetical protein